MTDNWISPAAIRINTELAAIASAVDRLLAASIRNLTDSQAFANLHRRLTQVRDDLEQHREYGLSLLLDDVLAHGNGLASRTVDSSAENLAAWGRAITLLADVDTRLSVLDADRLGPSVSAMNDLRGIMGENLLSASFAFSVSPSAVIETEISRQVQSEAQLQAMARRLRSFFQQGMVSWLRQQHTDQGTKLMRDVLQRLTELTGTTGYGRLWWVGCAFCDALAQRGAGASPSIKRLLGQLEHALKQLGTQGFTALDQEPSAALLRNLLFYIAGVPGSLVTQTAVWETFDLAAGADVITAQEARPLIQESLLVVCEQLESFVVGRRETLLTSDLIERIAACADALGLTGDGQLRRKLLIGTTDLALLAQADRGQVHALIDELLTISVGIDELSVAESPTAHEEGLYNSEQLPPRLESSLMQVMKAFNRLDAPVVKTPPAAADTADEVGISAPTRVVSTSEVVAFDQLIDLAGLASRTAELAPQLNNALTTALSGAAATATDQANPGPDVGQDVSESGVEQTTDEGQAMMAEGIQVDAALLDNLSLVAGEIGSSRTSMEQQVGGIRDGAMDLDLALREIREQVRHLSLNTIAVGSGATDSGERGNEIPSLGIGAERLGALQVRLGALSAGLARIDHIKSDIEAHTEQTQSLLNRQARDNVELRQGLMRSRWTKLGGQEPRIRQWFARAAAAAHKRVEVVFEHGGLEIEKSRFNDLAPVLRLLCDLVVSQALRDPEARSNAGVEPVATLTLNFVREVDELQVRLHIDDEDLGLAALAEVDQRVRAIGGRLEHYPGASSLHLFLGLAVQLVRVLLVRAAGECVAVPASYLTGMLRVPPGVLHQLDLPEPVLSHEGRDFRFVAMSELLDLGPRRLSVEKAFFSVVLLTCGERRLALLVDAVDDQEEVVMPPGHPVLDRLTGVAGAAVLADGRAVVVLDVPALTGLSPGLSSGDH